MSEENINQEFRLKKIDKIRTYLIEEVNQNELMSKNHKKVCRVSIIMITHYCNFYNFWVWFYLCFCFFTWYSHRNYEFCNWIKTLGNSRRN